MDADVRCVDVLVQLLWGRIYVLCGQQKVKESEKPPEINALHICMINITAGPDRIAQSIIERCLTDCHSLWEIYMCIAYLLGYKLANLQSQ